MDPNPREHLRQAIDAEIKSLKASFQQSLQTLIQRRNELAPILSLPTEIITDIILLVASAKGDDVGLAWLNVTHVCHQWREIALNQPLFWTHINLTNITSAGMAEMLSRAKEAPLHLVAATINWDDSRIRAFGKELQAHVSHIYHLNIFGTSHYVWTTLQHTLFASPAPILEYLSLFIPSLEGMVSISNTAFNGITPRLSYLELRQIMISWKSPLLRGLRYLKLFEVHNDDLLSVTEWLDALDGMPQLKELFLYEASPLATVSEFPFDIKRTATLPVLTHLYISSTPIFCALTLAHLVLPSLTSLVLEPSASYYDDYDALIIFPYIKQHAHGPQDANLLQSVFLRSNGACTHVIAWPMPDIHVVAHNEAMLEEAKYTARIALTITCERSHAWQPFPYFSILDAAIDALPLDSLVTLTAEQQAQFDARVWLRYAPRWPLLEHVQLAPRAARGLREILLLEDNGGHEGPLLPSLTKLDLIDYNSLTKRRTLRLCDALKKRMEQGVPLTVLSLRKCKWTIDAVRLLRRFVAEVRGPKGQTSWQEQGPPGWDHETCYFVDGYDNSDEEKESWYPPHGWGKDDEEEEEEEDEERDNEVEENDNDKEV